MDIFCCRICGVCELKTGRNQKVCLSESCQREDSRIRTQEYRRRKAIKENRLDRVDIGRGGGQPEGVNSKFYKTGIAKFHKLAPKIRKERRFCERCRKDLLEVNRYEWCVHHRDHDRTNNDVGNFELLCKRCHQIEHECWEAFETSTTIR